MALKSSSKGSLALFLMVLCSFLLASGQFFMKLGSEYFSSQLLNDLSLRGLFSSAIALWPVFVGLFLAAAASVVMTYSFKYGDLGALYPLISLSFVWTIIVARIFFNEPITLRIVFGVLLIILGVSSLGGGLSS